MGPPGPAGGLGPVGPTGPTGPTGSGVLGATIVHTNPMSFDGAHVGVPLPPIQVLCDSTERLLSGGFSIDMTVQNDLSKFSVVQSEPADNGWIVEVVPTATITNPFVVTASALCVAQ